MSDEPKEVTAECNPTQTLNQMYIDEQEEEKRRLYIKACSYLDTKFANWRDNYELRWTHPYGSDNWGWSLQQIANVKVFLK